MKYAQVESPHQITVKETQIPEPTDYEVLVRVRLCGIDWPTFKHVIEGKETTFPANGFNNLNLAHEASGEVVSVGKKVNRFKIGDRVSYLGPGFQEYAVVKADYCGKIPDGVEYLELLGEPMAVMYHSATKIQPEPEEMVAVFGIGYMGLGIIHFLSKLGAKRIVAVERDQDRLQLAKDMGAEFLINPVNQNPTEEILRLTNNQGVDIAIEASGSEEVLRQIGQVLRASGTLVVHGWFSGERKVRLDDWHAKDLTVKFSHPAPHEIYGSLIEEVGKMVADKKINLIPLITHKVSFSEIESLERIIKDSRKYLKGVVLIP